MSASSSAKPHFPCFHFLLLCLTVKLSFKTKFLLQFSRSKLSSLKSRFSQPSLSSKHISDSLSRLSASYSLQSLAQLLNPITTNQSNNHGKNRAYETTIMKLIKHIGDITHRRRKIRGWNTDLHKMRMRYYVTLSLKFRFGFDVADGFCVEGECCRRSKLFTKPVYYKRHLRAMMIADLMKDGVWNGDVVDRWWSCYEADCGIESDVWCWDACWCVCFAVVVWIWMHMMMKVCESV